MLAGVVSADDGRGGVARTGHGQRVVQTVSYERPVGGGALHRGAGAPAGERLGQLQHGEVQSQLDNLEGRERGIEMQTV